MLGSGSERCDERRSGGAQGGLEAGSRRDGEDDGSYGPNHAGMRGGDAE